MSKKNMVNDPKNDLGVDAASFKEFDEEEMRLKKKYKSERRWSYGSALVFGVVSVILFLYGIKVDSPLAGSAMSVSMMGGITTMVTLLSALSRKVRFNRGDYW